jgi:hypothetical protein
MQAESIAPTEHSEIANRRTPLATVHDYDSLQRALRERADALNLSRQEIDRLGNLTPGLASKLLSPVPIKRLGNTTMPFVLAALGCCLQLVEDPESLDQINRKAQRRQVRVPVRAALSGRGRHTPTSHRHLRKIAPRGGHARAQALSPAERSKSARRAALARWSEIRAVARGESKPNGSSAARQNGSRMADRRMKR